MSRLELQSTRELLRRNVEDAVAVCESLLDDQRITSIEAVADEIVRSLRAGGKVLLCGNGGSAADAQHLAAELVGRFCLEREALPALALADNIAAITAVANDYHYEDVFVRGVRALGAPRDVMVGISTSGSSRNVVSALDVARGLGLVTVALVGRADCAMAEVADHTISVPGPSTARIQEGQMLVGHTLFELVERELAT